VMFLPRGMAGLGTITPLQWLRGSKRSDGEKS
jgi:branched-chain amino acid transport system permease protein